MFLMVKSLTIFVVILSAVCAVPGWMAAQTPAPTPPMGWNSWDSYGLTIDEEQFRQNATVLVALEQYGWKYAVIDEGWYMANPDGKTVEQRQYLWNHDGLLMPAVNRFPSAADGAGFRPLADWLHSQGLKFGIHIVRGIPRQVVTANLPIAGTSFHAADAADMTSPCPWDAGNWGVKDNAAGQAYYDSMMKLYASWGVDFLKVDCISDRPWRPTEIRQVAVAIRKTGRPIVLSLSPGPTDLSHAAEVQRYAQMWRITDDHWDGWSFPNKPGNEYPFGLEGEFDRIARWFAYTGPGSWPDPDMLPEGWLGPHPGMGVARRSGYTPDEQRSEFTLWCVSRAPLILGGNLTRLDDLTRSLITNQTLLFVDQNSSYSRPVDASTLGAGFEHIRVWRATIASPGERGYAEFFAFFNLDASQTTVRTTWKALGLGDQKHAAWNVWDDSAGKESKEISVTLAPHGSAFIQAR